MSQTKAANSPPTVAVGKYRLELGSSEGTFALYQPQPEQTQAAALSQALDAPETEPAADATDKLETALGDAASITERTQRCVHLFTEIAEGSGDPHAISDEVDALLALLGRLDREGRHKEALRLARDLAALLALLLRWLDLIRSLQLARETARALGNEPELEAWALHELGSLHLAAGDAATAAKHLEEAVALKEEVGSHGRCASRHNLDAAQRDLAERAMLEQLRRRRLFRLGLIGATFLFLSSGGVALGISATSHGHHRTSARATTSPTTAVTTTPTKPITTTPTAVVDTTPPSPTLTTPADGSFIPSATPTFSGSASTNTGDSTIVTVFILDPDHAPAGGSPLNATRDGGSFSASVPDTSPLADGTYTGYAVQKDDAGNTGTSTTITFTVDTVDPTVTLTCGSLPNAVCTGTASELDQPITITLTDEGAVGGPQTTVATSSQTVPVASDHTFTVTLSGTSSSELYQVTASQTDAAGNLGMSKAVQLTTPIPR